jgi:peptidyl-prolyl cis-trans isomerase A (cyclophilin A)
MKVSFLDREFCSESALSPASLERCATRRWIKVNVRIVAGETALRTKFLALILTPLAVGFLSVPEIHPQAQSSQPRASVQPATSISSAQGTTTKKTTGTTATRPTYDRALLQPALLKERAPDQFSVKFTTTRGDFTVTVTRSWAPLGADRFYTLVKHHFYDNASFFRVLPNFVVQFGISAYASVSAAWKYASIKDDPVTQSNLRGYIVFGTAGPNTRTTQVFINLLDNKRLDSLGFAPFGQVTEGMSAVETMYQGYGENAPYGSGPDQSMIMEQGQPYLKAWPKLDYIKTAVLVAAAPSATTGDGEPTLPETMKFIQSKLSALGKVSFVAVSKDAIHGTTISNLRSERASSVVADARTCTIHYHWTTTLDDQSQSDQDIQFSFKVIAKIEIMPLQDALNKTSVADGHPELIVQSTNPQLWNLLVTRSDVPKQFNHFSFDDENIADRIAKAMTHAAELCGAGANKEPF